MAHAFYETHGVQGSARLLLLSSERHLQAEQVCAEVPHLSMPEARMPVSRAGDHGECSPHRRAGSTQRSGKTVYTADSASRRSSRASGMGPLPGSDLGAFAKRLALSLDRKPTSSLHHAAIFALALPGILLGRTHVQIELNRYS